MKSEKKNTTGKLGFLVAVRKERNKGGIGQKISRNQKERHVQITQL